MTISIICAVTAGLILGGMLQLFLLRKSHIKKPKISGEKREYFTQGELAKIEFKKWLAEVKHRAKI